jgi:hypothetical protein
MLILKANYYTNIGMFDIFNLDTTEGKRFLIIRNNPEEERLHYAITQSPDSNDISNPLKHTVILDPDTYGFVDLYKDWGKAKYDYSHRGDYYFNQGRYDSQCKEPVLIDYSQEATPLAAAFSPSPYTPSVKPLSGLSMLVIGGFIAAAGIVAITLALLLTSPAAVITLGVIGGTAMVCGGLMIFGGVNRMRNERADASMEAGYAMH